jgi:branched-chain amino acid transport system permease protein
MSAEGGQDSPEIRDSSLAGTTTRAVSARGQLECRGVEVSYGGLAALMGVDVSIEAGGMVGLIGPNGSGKSTFINVVSGAQKAQRAEIELDGTRIDGLGPEARARLGVARTFQALRLFDNLSVLDNVLLGASRLHRASLFASVLRTPGARREHDEIVADAIDLLSIFGSRLTPRLNDQVLTLSYANRRRVEIARAAMLRPTLLLLDEPTAGMNPAETEELAEQIPQLAALTGASVLLVEHKMDFITALCSRVYVLDHGACLAVGTPREVQQDPRVAEAFLGVE